MTEATTSADAPVVARHSTLDRLLPVWIGAAMGLGLLLGRFDPRPRAARSVRSRSTECRCPSPSSCS